MDEEIGLDDEDKAEIGALPPAFRSMVARTVTRAKMKGAGRVPGPRGGTIGAPTGGIARKRVPLGMGSHQFANAAATTRTFEVEPQRDFQGERLVISEAKVGASTAAILGTVTSVKIGDVEQLPGGLGVPVEMFFRDAVGAMLDLSNCRGGRKLAIIIAITAAPGAGDTITYTMGMYGAVVGE